MCSASILALGLATALLIRALTPPDACDPLEEITESKRYLHDLELYGGKANVLQDEFHRWFVGLWHGRALAGTVAYLSGLLFLGGLYLSSRVSPRKRLRERNGGEPPGT